jgi:hypothetical protein
MPGVSGATVVTNARVYYTTRAAAGALAPGIPHALFGAKALQTSGALRRESFAHVLKFYACLKTVIAGEAKQSILSLRGEMDCFVAFAPRNDGLGCLKFESEN